MGRSQVTEASTPAAAPTQEPPRGRYQPGRVPNEYSLLLPGERDALSNPPRVSRIEGRVVTVRWGGEERSLGVGESIAGWQLVAALPWLNGTPTAVFEKHVTHQGAIAYITERGEIAHIPKRVGDLEKIRPRPTNTPHGIKLERPGPILPGAGCGGQLRVEFR